MLEEGCPLVGICFSRSAPEVQAVPRLIKNFGLDLIRGVIRGDRSALRRVFEGLLYILQLDALTGDLDNTIEERSCHEQNETQRPPRRLLLRRVPTARPRAPKHR